MRRLRLLPILVLGGCTAIVGDRLQSADLSTGSVDSGIPVDSAMPRDLAGVDGVPVFPDFAGADLTGVLGLPSQANSTIQVTPASVPADGSSNAIITVTVKDAMNNAVVGQPVQLVASGTGAVITPSSGITNGLGAFNATVTSTKAETKTITATVFGFTLDGTTTFTPGNASQGSSTLTATPGTIIANGSDASTLKVTVKDANGNPISGQTVSFSVNGTMNTLTPAAPSTDANGEVTATLSTTKAEAKTVTATVGAFMLMQMVTANPGVVSAAQSTLTASPTSNLVANGAAGSTITATLKDANGNLIAGTAVTFASGAGTSFSQNNVASDGSGVATTSLRSTSAGAMTVTATAGGVTITQQPTVTFVACPSPVALSSTPQAGNTTGGSTLYKPVCALPTDSAERVYGFSLNAASSVIIDRGASFAGAVTDLRPAANGCSIDAQSLVCTDQRYLYCPSLPGAAGGTAYQVLVDGTAGATGAFSVKADIAAAKGTNSYGVVTTAPTFSTIAGAGGTVVIGTSMFKGATFATTMPIAFNFFGVNHAAGSPLVIYQNGYIGLGATVVNTYQNLCNLPTASLPAETIAPMWGRLKARAAGGGAFPNGSTVLTMTTGTAPNRVFTIEWNAFDGEQLDSLYECIKVSVQAILYEGSNVIEFRYQPANEDLCGSTPSTTTQDHNFSVGGQATIGIQGAQTGVLVEQPSCNTAGGTGPAVFGTCDNSNPDICTANKGYLFVPKSAGCP